MVCAQLARGEKEGQVIRSLCSTLQNTGSSPEIVATTMMASLRRVLEKQECDIMKDIGRTLHESGTESKLNISCLLIYHDGPKGGFAFSRCLNGTFP